MAAKWGMPTPKTEIDIYSATPKYQKEIFSYSESNICPKFNISMDYSDINLNIVYRFIFVCLA